MLGGPSYTFLEHFSTDTLIKDIAKLYVRLVDLGLNHQNGEVFLADLDG